MRRPLFPIQVPDQLRVVLAGAHGLASLVTVIGVVFMLVTIRRRLEIGGIEDGWLQPSSIEGAEISFKVSGANARSAQLLLDDFPLAEFNVTATELSGLYRR